MTTRTELQRKTDMSNPWLKKNPYMSMWLSGANRIAGSMMGHATAQAKRQTNAAMTNMASEGMKMWVEALSPIASKKRRKRRR